MQTTAKEIAALVEGSIEGNPDTLIFRPGKIEAGQTGDISFLGNEKYEHFIYQTKASAVLVAQDFQPRAEIEATLIRVPDVYAALATLLNHFGTASAAGKSSPGIAANAAVHPSASIGENVSIGAFAVVEAGAVLGNGAAIGAQAYIGNGVSIGANTIIYPGARILYNCAVGGNCIIHANAVIGSDGFGFAPQPDGTYLKIAQLGKVIIEDDVEVGAGTTIDRGSIGDTIIKKGVKLDNLIQVAHNVEIGENTVIAAQVGIAGSTKIGRNCRIAGQVGFIGHIHVADGTQIQAQTGVAQTIEQPGTVVCGYPAFAYRDYIRSHAVFKRLPDLDKKLKQLEDRLDLKKS
jgi:UDP-3-O-[3-hydroxymyristoyl] glucosamine N-acyltransferase